MGRFQFSDIMILLVLGLLLFTLLFAAGGAGTWIGRDLQVLYLSDHRLEIGCLPDGKTSVVLDIPAAPEAAS